MPLSQHAHLRNSWGQHEEVVLDLRVAVAQQAGVVEVARVDEVACVPEAGVGPEEQVSAPRP
jgi:hypothetical protein